MLKETDWLDKVVHFIGFFLGAPLLQSSRLFQKLKGVKARGSTIPLFVCPRNESFFPFD